ncbi:MAG: DUF4249 domain-containing protein [Cyclobacteriaceae bacterium]|nr:DUF4249 domain-containing protein [Cyclobacteriaceae bacterium]MCX7638063.1 DUF4249 domain-containing protein [Cyclobacteriaceae bacterium]MDW8331928.1 DUF4249 family protein [Cyclobacteriaceae bacterium]
MKEKIFVALLLLICGCVENYRIPELEHQPGLVVDGLITTEPGPHQVVLTTTHPLSNDYSNRQYVSNAILKIITQDDTVFLTESTDGKYLTPAGWQAEIRKSYTLFIELADGRKYRSDTQEIFPAGTINSLKIAVELNSINSTDPAQPQHSVAFYLDAAAAPGSRGLLRWRWKGIFQIESDPASKTRIDPVCLCEVPDPPPCADSCLCCSCWITEYSPVAVVSSNQFAENNQFRNRYIGRVPVEPWRFAYKYYVEAEQFSVTQSVYSFWKRVEAQQQSVSNIFQPNVIRVKGNITNVDNPAEEVFGIVAFSDVARKSRFIQKSDLPFILPNPPVIAEDCRLIFRNKQASIERPPFW